MTNSISQLVLTSTELAGQDKSKQESFFFFFLENTNFTCLALYFAFEYGITDFIHSRRERLKGIFSPALAQGSVKPHSLVFRCFKMSSFPSPKCLF